MSLAERGMIQFGRRQGLSYAAIAREVERNTSPDGLYYASIAHTWAHQSRYCPKAFKLRENDALCDLIAVWMDAGWSPKLISRMLAFTISDRPDEVADAMIREMKNFPGDLLQTITWDRGTELAEYRKIQTALNLKLYFCNPHSPWQRGTNENTNRLLRFWFEKGTDLSVHSAKDLRRVASILNDRPRPTLGLETPRHHLNLLLNAA